MSQLASQRPLVLIVEDDFLIRTATAEAVRDAGFEVLQAADADAAIVILEGRSDIQVVFTDVHMPGLWMARSWPTRSKTVGRPSVSLSPRVAQWKCSICRSVPYFFPSHTAWGILRRRFNHSLARERLTRCGYAQYVRRVLWCSFAFRSASASRSTGLAMLSDAETSTLQAKRAK